MLFTVNWPRFCSGRFRVPLLFKMAQGLNSETMAHSSLLNALSPPPLSLSLGSKGHATSVKADKLSDFLKMPRTLYNERHYQADSGQT